MVDILKEFTNNDRFNGTNMPEKIVRSLYVGIRYNETLASWQTAQGGEETQNIQWCKGSPTVRTNVLLTPASIYQKTAKWISTPAYAEYPQSTVCVKAT